MRVTAKAVTADMGNTRPTDFETLAMEHLGVCWRVATAYCRNSLQADDLVQTTFVKALEKFSTWQPGTNFKAWLLRILHNTWIDELRHRRLAGPAVSLDEQYLPDAETPRPPAWSNADDLLENFSDEQVIRALRELPEEQRLALFLVDVEQLDHREAAEILSVAVGTIKSRASRARNALKRKLETHARDLGFVERRS
ncbi:MAG: RNA polymerase sigma factor [Phycisphaerae bacterium]|nr:RNA polymerase sigma factor [Phycisphaerae bacterium]